MENDKTVSAREIYKQRLEKIDQEKGNDFIHSTGDFQCPDSGWGCIISWDLDRSIMWAEVCTEGAWKVEDENEISEDTYHWCNIFSIRSAENSEEANNVLRAWLGADADYYLFPEE
jgi:hypothetical protein